VADWLEADLTALILIFGLSFSHTALVFSLNVISKPWSWRL